MLVSLVEEFRDISSPMLFKYAPSKKHVFLLSPDLRCVENTIENNISIFLSETIPGFQDFISEFLFEGLSIAFLWKIFRPITLAITTPVNAKYPRSSGVKNVPVTY